MTPNTPRRFPFGHDPLPPRAVEQEPARSTLPLPLASRTTLPVPEAVTFAGPSWLARTTLPPASDAAQRPVLPFRSPHAPVAVQVRLVAATPAITKPRRASRRALATAALAALFVVLYAVGLGAFLALRRAPRTTTLEAPAAADVAFAGI